MSSHELIHVPPPSLPHPDLRVGVVGLGNVGMSLALALHARGHLSWAVAPSEQRRHHARMAFADVEIVASVRDIVTPVDWVIICTPDSSIASAAQELSASPMFSAISSSTSDAIPSSMLVSHCSGARHADELTVCMKENVHVAAMHPFQTFAYASERLCSGIAWGIECEPQSELMAMHCVRSIGGTPVVLTETARAHKEIYHAVAVIASNYLTSLTSIARDAAHAADISSLTFLQPIMRTAMENALTSIARDAAPMLTGPIARGDIATIRNHCSAMRSYPELHRNYVMMGMVTADVAMREKYIDEEKHAEMMRVFDEELRRRS